MSVDPEEADVLLSEFDQVLNTPPLRPALDEMVRMDVEADLKEIQQPLSPAPVQPFDLEERFIQSQLLQTQGIVFKQLETGIYELNWMNQTYQVTFDPSRFEDQPSLRLMTWGEPLFQALLNCLIGSQSESKVH